MAQWQPEFESFSAPVRKLKYLVRVYDDKGRFDETSPQPLWVTLITLIHRLPKKIPAKNFWPDMEKVVSPFRNIPLSGGTVQAHGEADVPEGHSVWMAGYAVPVDEKGSFVAEEILPEGIHTVEVAVLDKFGNGELFMRDLELKKSDWFTVGSPI